MSERDTLFSEWMKAHLGVLNRIARAFAEPADQHDLLQELMLAVWKAASSFRGDSAPVTFIYRVAHNRALTWKRRESGQRRRDAEAQGAWELSKETAGDPDAVLLDRLYAAIRQLAPLDRSLMLLALDGVGHREIGALHGLSETNVGVRLHRARARITELMETEDGL
jgi:RNA polymerase sigma-70 factor (ECF subfamily)